MCACLVFYSQLSGSGTVYTRTVCCAVHETAPGGTFRNKRDLLLRRQPPANEAVISIHGYRARPCVTKTPENSTARLVRGWNTRYDLDEFIRAHGLQPLAARELFAKFGPHKFDLDRKVEELRAAEQSNLGH